jgi:hypothetical protein
MIKIIPSGRARLVGIPFFAVLAASVHGCQDQSSSGVGVAKAEEAAALSAGVCIEDNWHDHGNSQNLTCTANDVRIARATNICVDDGNGGCKAEPTCIVGQDVTFTADFEVVLTAQDRYDVGVYFDVNGDPEGDGAKSGQCVLNTIDGTNAPITHINNDALPDVCGDIDAAHNPQLMTLTITTECVSDGDPDEPRLQLPYCTSWRQPGSNQVCDEAADAYPGSPSKCSCDDGFAIDIFVEDASATVTKTAVEACVAFDVVVTNTTQATDMVLATLVDAPYGDVTDATNANLCSTTCGQSGGAGVLPETLSAGETYSCRFTAKVASSATAQTDTVTASFTGETLTPSGSATILLDLDPAP